MARTTHPERHRIDRIGWLRAAVLGANDGIVSTASLLVGVAAASAGRSELMVAGVAGLMAGAMSMAAGEYVSVSSQSDTELADLAREREELRTQPEVEQRELALIYEARGLTPALAAQVAEQLSATDALGAHARDELGISVMLAARPLQAALASGITFTAGAILPLLTAWVTPAPYLVATIGGISLLGLVALGALAARAGGAPVAKAAARVAFWGVLAMGLTAGVGKLFGSVI